MTDINKAGVRASLSPRREPYWRHLEGTGFIGLRKMASGTQTWQARWRDHNGRRLQKSLGRVAAGNDYAAACKAARDWFAQCDQGVMRAGTVEEACRAYVDHIHKRSDGAGYDPHNRFSQLVYGTKFGKTPLDKLRAVDVERWLESLVTPQRGKSTANRIFRTFKAAMNYGLHRQLATSDIAWRTVKAFPAAEGRRENYLTKPQLRALLAAAPADLRDLLLGYLYTGCRPGELPKARVSQLSVGTGTLTLATSKGRGGAVRTREVPLAGAALAHFKRLAASKHPNAFLMTQANGNDWGKHGWSRGIIKIRNELDCLPDDFVAYDLRHTTISNWLSSGIHIEAVAKITGTSIAMIQKHYYKFIPTDIGEKLAAIDVV